MRQAPLAVPMDGMPARVTIVEVGPRDGLQNEPVVVPTPVKAEFVERLAGAGLAVIEATSFVHPGKVPQLADADLLLTSLARGDGRRRPVLLANSRGLDRALAAGADEVAIPASATEAFARRNLGRSLPASLAMFEPVVARARQEGMRTRAYLSMAFGDPWEGEVPVRQVVQLASRLLGLGCDELCVADTIGTATPGRVSALLQALVGHGLPVDRLAVHFHDTYGQALSNTLTALHEGVTVVDAAAGGLGGCPFAGSATGNLATEDLVWLLHGMGIETGVDLAGLVATSRWMADHLGRPSPSRVVAALP